MAIFKKASVTPIVRSVISQGILDDEHGYNFEMHPEDFKEVEDSWDKYLSSGIGRFNSELTSKRVFLSYPTPCSISIVWNTNFCHKN